MTVVAILVSLALAALAALHVYWGTGGVWPGTDEQSCARTIAGFRGIRRMPGAGPSFAVAAVLLVAAYLALAAAGYGLDILPAGVLLFCAAIAALFFIARGVTGYLPAWRRLTPEMPFARYDRRYYSPLCLALGAAFAFLTLQGLAA
jgi:nitroreductase